MLTPQEIAAERRRRREARIHDLRRDRDERERTLVARAPRLGEVLHELSGLAAELASTLLKGGSVGQVNAAYQSIYQRQAALMQERNRILAKLGADTSYLEVWWDCPACKNEGWIPAELHEDGSFVPAKRCECLIREEIEDVLKAAGIDGPLREWTFVAWDINRVFPEEVRPYMQKVKEFCEKWATDVAQGARRENLIFVGNPGVGKTYMSAAVANLVALSRKTVVYMSMNGYLEFVRANRYDSADNGQGNATIRRVMDADLMIIDDLGAERRTEWSGVELFELLNFRINMGKPTVISTNIEPREISEVYGVRLESRLLGNFDIIQFKGEDIRLSKYRERPI